MTDIVCSISELAATGRINQDLRDMFYQTGYLMFDHIFTADSAIEKWRNVSSALCVKLILFPRTLWMMVLYVTVCLGSYDKTGETGKTPLVTVVSDSRMPKLICHVQIWPLHHWHSIDWPCGITDAQVSISGSTPAPAGQHWSALTTTWQKATTQSNKVLIFTMKLCRLALFACSIWLKKLHHSSNPGQDHEH
jgi:hypothetical protein